MLTSFNEIGNMPTSEIKASPLLVKNGRTLTNNALRSGFFVTTSKVIRYGFVFLTHLVLMNVLNPSDFGMMRYVTIVLGLVNLFNEAGLKLAVVQKKELEKNEIASTFFISILFSCAIYVMIYVTAPLIAIYANSSSVTNLIRVGGLAAPVGGLSIIQRGLMQRQFRFARLSLIDVIAACGGSIFGLMTAFIGWGVWSIVSSVVIYAIISSTLCFFAAGIPFGDFFDYKASVKLIRFGTWDITSKFIAYLCMNIDYLIIGKYFGDSILGLYGFSFTTMMFANAVFGMIANDIVLSFYSRLQDEPIKMNSVFLKFTQATSLMFLPFFIIIFFLTPDLVDAISFAKGNTKWIPAVPYIQLLAPLGLLYNLGGFPNLVWTSNGLNRVRTAWNLFSLLTIVIALLIGAQFGVFAVCKALLIRGILLFPAGLLVNYKTFFVHPMSHIRAIVPSLLCGGITITVAIILSKMPFYVFSGNVYVNLIVKSFAILIIYVLTLRLLYSTILDELRNIFIETGLFNQKIIKLSFFRKR